MRFYALRVMEEKLRGRPRAFAMVCTYDVIVTIKVRCRGPGIDRTYGPAVVQMEGRLRVARFAVAVP